MAILTDTYSVTNSAPLAVAIPVPNAGPNDPTPFYVQNIDTVNSVWLGGADVASSGENLGIVLLAGSALAFSLFGSDTLYAISTQAGGVNVVVMQGRQ